MRKTLILYDLLWFGRKWKKLPNRKESCLDLLSKTLKCIGSGAAGTAMFFSFFLRGSRGEWHEGFWFPAGFACLGVCSDFGRVSRRTHANPQFGQSEESNTKKAVALYRRFIFQLTNRHHHLFVDLCRRQSMLPGPSFQC